MLSCYGIETQYPPSPRIGHSLNFLKDKNKIVLFGGASIEEGTSNDLFIYNSINNTWNKQNVIYKKINGELSKLPEPRYEHTSIIYRNKDDQEELLIFGGTTGAKLLNDIHIFNFESKNWRAINAKGDIPPPRTTNSGVYINNNKMKSSLLIFCGSQYNSQPINDTNIYILNFENWEWKKIVTKTSPSIRLGHSMTATNDSVYLFGGLNNNEVYNDLWEFNIETQQWKDLTNEINPNNRPKPRSGHSAVYNSGLIYIFGGMQCNPPHVFEDVHVYNIEKKEWKEINPVVCTSFGSYKPRLGHSSCLITQSVKAIKSSKVDEKELEVKKNLELGNSSSSSSSLTVNENKDEVKKEDKRKEENVENVENSIQEINFTEEIDTSEIDKVTNEKKTIMLFGGADFYGMYNDVFLMNIEKDSS